jgi:beta-ketodecanoyl-[acyl-carrier-protein] synthase
MTDAVIAATGLYTPPDSLSNAELVETFNTYVERFNERNAEAIAAGEVTALMPSSPEFIEKASGHQVAVRGRQDRPGRPGADGAQHPERPNEELSVLAEMAVAAAEQAIAAWGKDASQIDAGHLRRLEHAARLSGDGHRGAAGAGHRRLRLRHERGLLVGHLRHQDRRRLRDVRLGARGADGQSGDLFGPPELPRPRQPLHLRRRGDRGDRRAGGRRDRAGWDILGTRLRTQFSNNIRNNFGFLNRAAPEGIGAVDKLFVQEGRKVFREVVPLVSDMIVEHAADLGIDPHGLKRLWLHQANINMNEMIGRRVLGRDPTPEENVIILDEYANTSSAGSIIAFHKANADFAKGETGLICSFGAGYSAGTVFVRKR